MVSYQFIPPILRPISLLEEDARCQIVAFVTLNDDQERQKMEKHQ